MHKRRVPQYLSAPFQILWFESDDLALMSIGFILALLFGGWFWLAMVAVPWLYMKMKHRYPRGFLRHTMYFLGFIRMPHYPTAFEKEFQE